MGSILQSRRTARRFVSILISSALAYTDNEMKLNRIFFTCLERICGRCELWHVLDHYFNVCLGVSGREMELTRTCCFEFDRKKRPGGKVSFLRHICVYFRLAHFTSLSLLPQVDKLYQNTARGDTGFRKGGGLGKVRFRALMCDVFSLFMKFRGPPKEGGGGPDPQDPPPP